MSFRDVLECQVSKREEVSHCEFSRLKYVQNAGKLELITHYAVDIVLSIRSLDGLLSRTDDTRDLEKKNGFSWTYSWDNL